jgi:DNA ligase-associated metallophosphoesterase
VKVLESLKLEIRGQSLILLPEKAIFWEDKNGLIISDVHLGKAGHFRKNGIALPQSSNDENLHRIDSLIENLNPDWILFLGDLFHSEKNEEWESFRQWRVSHKQIEIKLVLGNHELYPEEEYRMLGISCYDKYTVGPFLFIHDDRDASEDNEIFTFSGHIHPSVRMKGKGRQSLRIPCFYFDESRAILPAFGTLTGTHAVKLTRKSHVYGVLENQIFQIQ